MESILIGINKWITGEEEQISEPENRTMEITAAEKNSGKEWKEIRRVSETSGTKLNASPFKLYQPQKKTNKKGLRKYLKRLLSKNLTNMGKEIVTQVQEVQRVHTG